MASRALEDLDLVEEERGLDAEERKVRTVVARNLWDIDWMLEVSWRQKSRAL